MRYRLLDHTADLKVVIVGADLKELFANAAFAVFDCMLEQGAIQEKEQREVVLVAPDLAELFLDWLRELLFLFSTQGLVVARVQFHEPPAPQSGEAPNRLRATVYGESYEPARHGLKLEIKNPTYHDFQLTPTPAGWQATVLFDV